MSVSRTALQQYSTFISIITHGIHVKRMEESQKQWPADMVSSFLTEGLLKMPMPLAVITPASKFAN